MKSARSLVVIERTTTFDQDEEPTIAFYTTSHSPTRGFASKQSVDAGTGLRQL